MLRGRSVNSQMGIPIGQVLVSQIVAADLWKANLQGAKFVSVVVNRKTFIWGCSFDEQTIFHGGGLSKARIEPRLIEHMRKNIPIY